MFTRPNRFVFNKCEYIPKNQLKRSFSGCVAELSSAPQTNEPAVNAPQRPLSLESRRCCIIKKKKSAPGCPWYCDPESPSAPARYSCRHRQPGEAPGAGRRELRTRWDFYYSAFPFRLLFLRCCKLHRGPRSSLANVNGEDVSWLIRVEYLSEDYKEAVLLLSHPTLLL